MAEPASVSAVVPCWRAAGTIRRAVDSIASQTRPALEVLLVDDASGDGTLETLREMARRYPPNWIKVIALAENGGPGPARNAGWEAARGDHVAFLDADDAWHPRKLELQMGWLSSHPEVALSGHRSVLLKEGQQAPAVDGPGRARRVGLADMLISNRFSTRSVIVKRTLPFRFQGRRVTEDYLLWLEIVASGAPAFVLEAPLAFSFRPDYSAEGYSGRLWAHERRELAALASLRATNRLPLPAWWVASAWSLCKYARREWIVRRRP